MRLVIISDTHGQHEDLELPDGDVLIHCGDFSSGRGSPLATYDFNEWIGSQNFKHTVYIAGNHDQYAAKVPVSVDNDHYLCDSSIVIDGVKFYGMPWTPTFFDWYWMKNRGDSMKKVVDQIPLDTEVLITHGPQAACLDNTQEGYDVGCSALGLRIDKLQDLKVHCFGHIHEAYGTEVMSFSDEDPQSYTAVNASVLDERYRLVNEPIVVDL